MRLLRHGLPMLAALGALAVLVVGNASAQESSATGLMDRANERYERGEYAEAAQQYEALIDRGYSDATLYLNLGNSYFESEDLGRAILSYLRARELSPRDMDIRHNLELARGMTVDRVVAEGDSLVESVSYFGHRWATPGRTRDRSLALVGCDWDSHWGSPGVAGLTPKARVARCYGLCGCGYGDVTPACCEHGIRQSL